MASSNVRHGSSPSQYGRRPQTHVKMVPKPANEDAGTEIERQTEFSGEICPACWPDGWPEYHASAGCIHGNWERAISIEVGEPVVITGKEIEL